MWTTARRTHGDSVIERLRNESMSLLIPINAETCLRLVRFAKAVGKDPAVLAAELLQELLFDEEFNAGNEIPGSPGQQREAQGPVHDVPGSPGQQRE